MELSWFCWWGALLLMLPLSPPIPHAHAGGHHGPTAAIFGASDRASSQGRHSGRVLVQLVILALVVMRGLESALSYECLINNMDAFYDPVCHQ